MRKECIAARVTLTGVLAISATVLLSGCDPVVNIAGANFPAWLLCAIVGGILAFAVRPIFTRTGLEPHLGPLVIIYPSLAVLLGCLVFLIFFNRV